MLRRFFAAALITRTSIERLLTTRTYDVASFNHGIYVPQGIVGAVARRQGVRVVNWIQSYRKNSFIFSHGDTYHHTLMTEPVSTWEDLDWDDERDAELMGYLRSRWTGAEDWISFNRTPETELDAIVRETGIDFSKPTIGLLTNVMWDAQLHYPQNAFRDMWEWMAVTIAYFAKRPSLQLVIRVHPAELRGAIRSRQPIADEIRKEIGELPPNIFIIPPDSSVSTYTVMAQCDSVLIYGTKTGVELTSLGIPVIVAGEAWIRGKGITTDVRSPEHYREILDSLPADPVPAVTVTLPGPVHAFGVLRREAERRGVSCAELIAVMSAERKAELPPWWLEIAEKREVGVLDRAAANAANETADAHPER